MMEETYCYYIAKGYMGEKIKVPFGIRIFKYKSNLPWLPLNSDFAQGPYKSIEVLEQVSPIIQELKTKYNESQYSILFEDKNIPELKSIILMPKDKGYPLDLVHMIMHGTKGEINRNFSTGGHFLGENKVRVIELLGTDKKGVLKAKIEVLDFKKNIWVPKKATTTLFPEAWSLQKYVNECRHCIENRHQVEGDVYRATTKCGIETILIIENNKVVTFYPKFEK